MAVHENDYLSQLDQELEALIQRLAHLLPPPRPQDPVGGCLQKHAVVWECLQAPTPIQRILREGYVLPFKRMPPLAASPMPFLCTRLPELREQVSKLHMKQAIERVPSPAGPGFYSRLFVVPKATGGFRPVIDLSLLTPMLKFTPFQMDTPASIRQALRDSSWAATIDLSDAYFHIPIHPSARKYLRFYLDGQVWQFRALPFGLSSAPFLFTWMVRVLRKTLRTHGIQFHTYLDDWILHHTDRAKLERQVDLTVKLASIMGFRINLKKSNLVPAQNFQYLGMEFSLDRHMVFPPLDKCHTLQALIQPIMTTGSATAAKWGTLIGKMTFLSTLIPRGRLHLRPLQHNLKTQWNFNWRNRHQVIRLSKDAFKTLKWWVTLKNLRQGTPLQTSPPTLQLFTDACLDGWGAHLGTQMVSGTWTDVQKSWHINQLELQAVILAINHFQDVLRNQVVLIATDNSTTLSYIRKQGGTKSYSLNILTTQLFKLASRLNLTLHGRHIPGRKNVLADQLSRAGQVAPTEWTLHQEVLTELWTKWPRPQVDAFATSLNTRLPLYFSPVPDDQALAVDAMSQDWSLWDLHMFPPFPLLPAVVRKLHRPHANVTLIVPWNSGASWFPGLLQLLALPGTDVQELPLREDLLFQPLAEASYPNLPTVRLTACFLPQWPCSDESSLDEPQV